jgi:hypothetical protein
MCTGEAGFCNDVLARCLPVKSAQLMPFAVTESRIADPSTSLSSSSDSMQREPPPDGRPSAGQAWAEPNVFGSGKNA